MRIPSPRSAARRPARPGHSRRRRWIVRARFELARRAWLRWTAAGIVALVVGLVVHDRVDRVDDARRAWGEVRTAFVAVGDHEPGSVPELRAVELPLVAVPGAAVVDLPAGARLRRSLTDGEIVVAADLAVGPGPAAGAPDGTVVVALSDPLVPSADVGARVEVYAEGIVLATDARVVGGADEVVLVAVHPADAPIVAAAAQARTASIAFPA